MAEIEKSSMEIAEIVGSAMRDFNSAMKCREDLSIRIGKRTTQIIRSSMFGMVLLTVAIIVLLHILISEMNHMTVHLEEIGTRMQTVNQNVVLMTTNLQGINLSVEQMKQSIEGLNTSLKIMPIMNTTINKISQDMGSLNQNVGTLSSDVTAIRYPLDNMSIDLEIMREQVVGVNRTLGIMGRDADRMMTPMKFLPFPP